MFFLLSKILAFAIKPVMWLLGLLAYALWTRRPVRRRNAIRLALMLLLLFSNRWFSNQVFLVWEPKTLQAQDIDAPYDIGIVLGGYSNPFIVPGHDRHNLSERGNRIVNALELYHTGKIKKILLSGGTGRLWQDAPPEAEAVAAWLERMGIPPGDVIVEPQSRNTWENAVFTKNLVATLYPKASCLLITSAWHIPRAQACFQKAGLDVTPFAVDYISERNRWDPDLLFMPDKLGLYKWELLVKEWAGMAAYRWQGYN